jgi:hypothetical protein
MIDLARAQQDSVILPRLVKIEERLIGIDGNGTGRDGAIQVLGKKVDGVSGKVDQLLNKDVETKGALAAHQKDQANRWWKQPLWTGLVAGFAGAFFAAFFWYLEHRGH